MKSALRLLPAGKHGGIWACISTADALLHSLRAQHDSSGQLHVEVSAISQAAGDATPAQVVHPDTELQSSTVRGGVIRSVLGVLCEWSHASMLDS